MVRIRATEEQHKEATSIAISLDYREGFLESTAHAPKVYAFWRDVVSQWCDTYDTFQHLRESHPEEWELNPDVVFVSLVRALGSGAAVRMLDELPALASALPASMYSLLLSVGKLESRQERYVQVLGFKLIMFSLSLQFIAKVP